jgi:hypothetical protein
VIKQQQPQQPHRQLEYLSECFLCVHDASNSGNVSMLKSLIQLHSLVLFITDFVPRLPAKSRVMGSGHLLLKISVGPLRWPHFGVSCVGAVPRFHGVMSASSSALFPYLARAFRREVFTVYGTNPSCALSRPERSSSGLMERPHGSPFMRLSIKPSLGQRGPGTPARAFQFNHLYGIEQRLVVNCHFQPPCLPAARALGQ